MNMPVSMPLKLLYLTESWHSLFEKCCENSNDTYSAEHNVEEIWELSNGLDCRAGCLFYCALCVCVQVNSLSL